MSLLKRRRRDYHGVNPHIDPKRLRKQEKSGRLQRILNRIYGVIIIGALFWLGHFIFFSDIFKIKNINFIPEEEGGGLGAGRGIDEVVGDFLASKRYWIFNQKNFFILDKETLEKRLQEKFFLAELKIEKDFPNGLKIFFQAKVDRFNLCLEEKCYLVDYLGNVAGRMDKAEADRGLALVYYYKTEEARGMKGVEKGVEDSLTAGEDVDNEEHDEDDNNIKEKGSAWPKIRPGLTKIPEKKARIILELFEVFLKEAPQLELDSLEIYDFDGLARKITIKTRGGLKIFFDEQGDLKEQIKKLNLILAKELKKELIEYIDLRFEKIYYKERY